jgi:transcriptional regulator with XRE-family HTH domain
MQMKKILDRLHGQLRVKGLSAAAVSRQATGSPDTIRNWERRAKADKNPGASSVTLGAIAEVLGVPIDWLMGYGPDDLEQFDQSASMKEQIIEVVDRLPASMRAVALKQLSALVPEPDQEPEAKPGTADGL